MKSRFLIAIISTMILSQAASAVTGYAYYWTKGGFCGEFTPGGGTFLAFVSYSYCERSQGAIYSWSNGGFCAEYTKDGKTLIAIVDSGHCERGDDVVAD